MKFKNFKKITKISICGLLSLIILLCFAACASPALENGNYADNVYEDVSPDFSLDSLDSSSASGSLSSSNNSFKNEITNDSSDSKNVPENSQPNKESPENNVSTNRKIITTYSINTETKEFDKLYSSIREEVNKLNGYFETSSTEKQGNYRYATMTIRIPQSADEQITSFITDNSNVVYSESETNDVTLTYTDIASKIEAYKLEKTQLESLMAKATNLTEILEIQDRLTEVIYQIETREAQLRTYDNLVDYTTIHLTIREVEIETITTEQTVFEKIKDNLVKGFKNIGNFFISLFIVVVSSIPYLLIIAVVVAVVIVIIKCKKKKCKKNKENK